MQLTVPAASVARAEVQSIAVGGVQIGPIRIGRLALSGLDFAMSTGVAHLRNFRITVSLRITLDWHIHIGLPDGIPDIDVGDTIDLGDPSFELGLGDVVVPGLDHFSVHLDSAAVDDLATSLAPLANLSLGAAVAEQVRARNVVLPAAGFQIAGLAFTALRAEGIGIPAATIEEITADRVHGEAALEEVAVAGFGLPGVAVGDIASQGVDVSATATTVAFHMDAGILELTLSVTPTAEAQIDALEISGITATTSVRAIEARDVVVPYEVLGLTLADVGIETIELPSLAAI